MWITCGMMCTCWLFAHMSMVAGVARGDGRDRRGRVGASPVAQRGTRSRLASRSRRGSVSRVRNVFHADGGHVLGSVYLQRDTEVTIG